MHDKIRLNVICFELLGIDTASSRSEFFQNHDLGSIASIFRNREFEILHQSPVYCVSVSSYAFLSCRPEIAPALLSY